MTQPKSPPLPPPVVEYATQVPRNVDATRGVIAGSLGFLPFLPGALAIYFGRRGVRAARLDPRVGGQGAARTAIVLGVVSLVVWTGLAIAAVPAMRHARRQALATACMSNLRQFAMAEQIYAVQSGGHAPANLDQLVAARIVPAAILTCPACAGDPTKPVSTTGTFGASHYVYVGAGRSLKDVRPSWSTVLAYEPLTNHGTGAINVAHFDGHVERHEGPAAVALLAQLAAVAPTTALAPTTASAPGGRVDVEAEPSVTR